MAFAAPHCAVAQAITLRSLLDEMTDLIRLTRMPSPAYTTGQASSYDRRSTNPAIATDENWFANNDRGQFIRTETNAGREEFVMMDASGPGAIVRFWSANPVDAGTLRIYLDGTGRPALEIPMAEFLGGKSALAPEPIGGERARGWNSYLPIPYAKHCKVTADKRDFYYLIDHRTYAPCTEVETFTPAIAEGASAAIQSAAKALAAPGSIAPRPQGKLVEQSYSFDLVPGASSESEPLKSSGMLLEMTALVDTADLETALRGCLLEVLVDGQAAPLVQAPLGDFFGTVPGPNPYESLPSGVRSDGTMYCRWPMPFHQELHLRITNHTDAPVRVAGRLAADLRDLESDTLYFHAKWRTERDLVTLPRQDWNFATLRGHGRYVGTMLHVTNPIKNWWGEGDEKVYVDGAAFPNWFGTGSEDYFGYAWCSEQAFTHAYHNQPHCDGPWNFGQTCVSRFHVMDDIPFTESLKFDMEVWRGIDVIAHQSAMSYWYAAPGGTDNFTPPTPDQLAIPATASVPKAPNIEGAIEGERMKLVARTGGRVLRQFSDQWPWSGGAHRWWIGGAEGDRIAFEFNAEAAGNYEVFASLTRAPDFGIVQLAINGTDAGAPRDGYSENLEFGPEFSLGQFALLKGPNTISATIRGTSPKASPARMFGLDYVRMVKR